ncbi:hypothetical protein P691DRAFT_762828 [Macrolepiota fuliginosa MF-IS2]|uniref:Uncharacterized protein n=1 Tax=Macrolepiota fuliginosa MF-IS2 TaxID=1400762 RepID=A0A9P5X814_9AGAR|nr:hypothetical protein P691DRAFT_762828 [Macrolepiota fuliginosa MF-IS2]
MFNTTYLPHAIYSLAITSVSIHLVSQKRIISDDRTRVAARLSILESIANQLRQGKDISLDELDRLHQLARPPAPAEEHAQQAKEEIGWKEVIFGRKKSEEPEMSEYDRRDWEKVQKEMETQK